MVTESAHILPIAGEKPSQLAERVGRGYADASVQKKDKGQYIKVAPETKAALLLRNCNPSKWHRN